MRQTARAEGFSPLLRPEYNPSALSEEERALALLCQALHDLPEAEDEGPVLSVQQAFRIGNVPEAISLIRDFLAVNGLDHAARKHAINPTAFRYQRRRNRLTQEALARALGVKAPQISHVEQGRNSLSLPRIVLALSCFGVQADEILAR